MNRMKQQMLPYPLMSECLIIPKITSIFKLCTEHESVCHINSCDTHLYLLCTHFCVDVFLTSDRVVFYNWIYETDVNIRDSFVFEFFMPKKKMVCTERS
jgi:hypothetical protein